mmetsp:Transcript_10527/g.33501  ORF Transcript_10527/g.33501 Transcript_10527/m.33501 type:complete len:234 (-) Transcript_10527:954-1655(-)
MHQHVGRGSHREAEQEENEQERLHTVGRHRLGRVQERAHEAALARVETGAQNVCGASTVRRLRHRHAHVPSLARSPVLQHFGPREDHAAPMPRAALTLKGQRCRLVLARPDRLRQPLLAQRHTLSRQQCLVDHRRTAQEQQVARSHAGQVLQRSACLHPEQPTPRPRARARARACTLPALLPLLSLHKLLLVLEPVPEPHARHAGTLLASSRLALRRRLTLRRRAAHLAALAH